MVQGLIAGCTDYNEQTLEDILGDILQWKELLIVTTKSINQNLEILKEEDKIRSIGDDFRITIFASLKCFDTFVSDFDEILSSIQKRQITAKEIKLMTNIGKKAIEYNHDYGKTWNINYSGWKCYDEKWFSTVEDIYANGRDAAVTLQDCLNVSKRLEDYKVEGTMVNQHNIINGSANISGVNNGTMNVINSSNLISETKEAMEKITQLDCPEETKQPFLDLLTDISENKLTAENAECDMKGIKILNLPKAYKVLSVLSTFATLASFCGIQI